MEDKTVDPDQSEQRRKKQNENKNEQRPKYLWAGNKRSHIHVITVPEKEVKVGRSVKVLKEVWSKNIPNLARHIKPEDEQIPN